MLPSSTRAGWSPSTRSRRTRPVRKAGAGCEQRAFTRRASSAPGSNACAVRGIPSAWLKLGTTRRWRSSVMRLSASGQLSTPAMSMRASCGQTSSLAPSMPPVSCARSAPCQWRVRGSARMEFAASMPSSSRDGAGALDMPFAFCRTGLVFTTRLPPVWFIGREPGTKSAAKRSRMTGTATFVLHSHLPYCRLAGRWPHGEEWLHEATLECYLPLIRAFRRLSGEIDGPLGVTINMTPILAEQLGDPLMRDHFREYLAGRIGRARSDVSRFASAEPWQHAAAEFHLARYQAIRAFYEDEIG